MEDVAYLRQHAQEESYLFVLDSARRDTAVHPDPNEYEICFRAPFRNVVGLDLVDATVPRTEYIVENGGNALRYTHAGTRYVATVTPGDYSILQLLEALTAAMEGRVWCSAATVPAEVSNKAVFYSEEPFEIHAAESTMRRALGLGFGPLTATAAAIDTRRVIQGPLPASGFLPPGSLGRQTFVAPASGTPLAAQVYVASDAPVTVRVAIVSGDTLVAEGSAATTGVDFEQLSVPLVAVDRVVKGGSYQVVVDASSARVFCEDGVSTGRGGGAWWSGTAWSAGTGALCLDVDMTVAGYSLQPPGVVNLTGEPFVLVRCPTIETELYRDRAYESVHAGLGLVNLGNYGFREQRYDFTSFPSRRLPTPLGKLSKLTIRLEKSDGTLYDTKGVDHHLVLSVRYLELTKAPEAMRSTLNPGYMPNPMDFLRSRPVQ